MTDPLAIAAGKIVAEAGSEVVKTTGGLLTRLLGPSMDSMGLVLAQYSEYRLRNLLMISEKADRKARDPDGVVPPRVAHRIIEEGSYCDDELMAEYLSGLLAASRTPLGRDDRAIAWTELVTGMSSFQIRAHFIIYRELAFLLDGRSDLMLSTEAGRRRACLDISLPEFIEALMVTDVPSPESAVMHSFVNLARMGLISPEYSAGPSGAGLRPVSPHSRSLVVMPTIPGIELFGWVLGVSDMGPANFADRAARLCLVVNSCPPRVRAVINPSSSGPESAGDV